MKKILGCELVLASNFLLLLGESSLLSLACLPDTDGCQEWFEMVAEILRVDAKVPVEEEKQLLLHEVDFSDREAEALVAADSGSMQNKTTNRRNKRQRA